MKMPFPGKPLTRLLLVALPLIAVMALATPFLEHDVHAWRHAGECLECHVREGDAAREKEGWTIPPPEGHTERFRRYTHGRGAGFDARRCDACHRREECRDCHARMPESHTGDFVAPRGLGMERHTLLASVRPATCLACHTSFASACVTCHTAAEVKPWERRARAEAGARSDAP